MCATQFVLYRWTTMSGRNTVGHSRQLRERKQTKRTYSAHWVTSVRVQPFHTFRVSLFLLHTEQRIHIQFNLNHGCIRSMRFSFTRCCASPQRCVGPPGAPLPIVCPNRFRHSAHTHTQQRLDVPVRPTDLQRRGTAACGACDH